MSFAVAIRNVKSTKICNFDKILYLKIQTVTELTLDRLKSLLSI